MNSVLTLLPPRVRQIIYVVYGLAGLAVSSSAVAYGSLDLTSPSWLKAAAAVVAALAPAIGTLAALKVAPESPTPSE